MRTVIRSLSSGKQYPPRFCDLIIDSSGINLEVKTGKDEYRRITWEEMEFQVNTAIKQAEQGK